MEADTDGPPPGTIATHALTKHYGSVQALVDLTLDVRSGEIFGFLGPNGAGKTTTMRVLTCFLPPTAGTATICGFDVLENPQEVNERVIQFRRSVLQGIMLWWDNRAALSPALTNEKHGVAEK